MEYTVIADSHFGRTHDERLLLDFIFQVRMEGRQIIWLGDTYDILCFEDSVKTYSHHILQNDIFLTGNHDWGIVDRRELSIGDVFLTHGDLVDFGYGFGRLQQVCEGRVRGTWLERAISKLRTWSMADTFTFYDLKYTLTDAEVAGFQSNTKIKYLWSYAKLFVKLLNSPTNPPHPLRELLPEPTNSEKYMGYLTLNPTLLLERIIHLYPNAANHTTLVIGHLHHHIDQWVNYKGRKYRLISLNSWVQDESPQILNISLSDGTIQVIDVE